jgi:isocitrate dehydrogenase
MLEYMGWPEAAQLIHKAVEATIIKRQATKDLAIQIDDAKELSTNGFGQAVLDNM